MRGKVDDSKVIEYLELMGGKSLRVQTGEGRYSKVVLSQAKTRPTVTVTDLEREGLLEEIVDTAFQDEAADDPSFLAQPGAKQRFVQACEEVLTRFREENTQSREVLKTIKQRTRGA